MISRKASPLSPEEPAKRRTPKLVVSFPFLPKLINNDARIKQDGAIVKRTVEETEGMEPRYVDTVLRPRCISLNMIRCASP